MFILHKQLIIVLHYDKNAGQLGLGSSRPVSSPPGQISAWSHIKPGGNVFNKKEFI